MNLLQPADWKPTRDLVKSLVELYRRILSAFLRTGRLLNIIMDTDDEFFKPPRVAQSTEPTLSVGQMVIWRDTDDGKVYIVYNDEDSGQKTVELT